MTWAWVEQRPHPSAKDAQHPLHILVGTDLTTGEETYLAFITVVVLDGQNVYRAMAPHTDFAEQKKAPPVWHYTHDSLQEAKDWCVAELVNRRLT